jgi:hypothetical protein
MTAQIKWEYRVFTVGGGWTIPKDEEVETALNQLGEECWEVFSLEIIASNNKIRVAAKRPMDLRTRRRRSMPGEV